MSASEIHIEFLAGLGYSRLEIAFLDLVTAHSGYFVSNQYLEFTGLKRGRALQQFREKLFGYKHADCHAYRNGARVYRIFARKLYQALEHDSVLARRKHALEEIQTRLVVLDFILANPSCQFLKGESQKIRCFTEKFFVPEGDLPRRAYVNRWNCKSTVRYFADQFPMFWTSTDNSEEPLLTFTFIDSGQPSVQPFITHLSAYRPLFSRLKAFAFIYVAPSSRLFGQAETVFRQIVLGMGAGKPNDEILRYFRIRRAWEGDERVPGADVVYLKNSRRRFSGEEVESLYQQWASDALSSDKLTEIWRGTFSSCRAVFQTAIHGQSLSVFSGNVGRELEPQAGISCGGRSIETRVSNRFKSHLEEGESFTALIPKVEMKRTKKITARLDEDLHLMLQRYAVFLGEATSDYIITESLKLLFRRDREFKEWLDKTNPEITPEQEAKGQERVEPKATATVA